MQAGFAPKGLRRADKCSQGSRNEVEVWERLRQTSRFHASNFRAAQPCYLKNFFVIASPGAKSIGHRVRAALTHNELDWALDRKIRELDAHILKMSIEVYSLDLDTLDLTKEPF